MQDELIKQSNIQEIARRGSEIYGKLRVKFEPNENGKFLAIDVDTEKTYLGNTSAEAVEKARQENPGKVFYVMKIGSDVAETMAHTLLNLSHNA